MVHNLEIIGEAARGTSQALRERHPDVLWREIVGTRDVLAHGYFRINVDRVWTTVERDLPKLKQQVASIIAATQERDSAGRTGRERG